MEEIKKKIETKRRKFLSEEIWGLPLTEKETGDIEERLKGEMVIINWLCNSGIIEDNYVSKETVKDQGFVVLKGSEQIFDARKSIKF
jgi:hypothetical protein